MSLGPTEGGMCLLFLLRRLVCDSASRSAINGEVCDGLPEIVGRHRVASAWVNRKPNNLTPCGTGRGLVARKTDVGEDV